MTYDFFMGQLRLIAVALIAFATGKGWLSSADATFISALLPPIGAICGIWIWSIYRNVNSKLVPKDSVAIAAESVVNAQTAAASGVAVIHDGTAQVAAKVVGCLFALSMLPALFSPALAQTPKPRPFVATGNVGDDLKNIFSPAAPTASTTTGNSAFDNAFAKLSAKLQEVEKAVVDKAIADVQAALDDANKHNDEISKPCWQAHLDFFKQLPSQWDTPPAFRGVALSIQIQRDLLNAITGTDKSSLKVACAALYGDQLALIGKVGLLFGFTGL